MSILKKNLMDLALRNKLVGSKVYLEDGIKTIEEFIDYDSITHTFMIKFTNGDIQEISDKLKFTVEVDGLEEQKPNKKRAK